MSVQRVRIHITGIVQGVGMRPFVYREAVAAGVRGWVLNAGDGVHIEAAAEQAVLDAFMHALCDRAPAAARIDGIVVSPAGDAANEDERSCSHASVHGADAREPFRILASSEDAERTTLVSPDIATCSDCLRELFDPGDRRYHYPFINCTNCGPRFTIIRSLPYDRAATSMAAFPMCDACAREYADPLDRRFHAQPDACFACGPHITWRELTEQAARVGATRAESDNIIERCADVLAAGGIVAIKGLGGFHLACNAGDERAVATLRVRKRRPKKPFALMVRTMEDIERICAVSDGERSLLAGSVRPIVLVRPRSTSDAAHAPATSAGALLAPNVAFQLPELGVMLPYTPLQHLLLAACASRGIGALVMTSGNVSGEPIETDDARAWERLVEGGIADALLGNDRAILSRYDDSVVRVDARGSELAVRRARGYAPQPIELPAMDGTEAPQAHEAARAAGSPCILACGAEQKATLALTREQGQGAARCFLSQHIGDVEHASALDAWHEARERACSLFELEPSIIACDLHPTYLTAQWARSEAARRGLPLIEVQHHHAHIAAAIAEAAAYEGFDAQEPVVGIAFDGTGAGTDNAIWGGEFLVATLSGFERAAHLAPWPLPGGAAAIHDPRRSAFALLRQHDLLGHPGATHLLQSLGDEARDILDTMLTRSINSPLTSSMGRFLDACAAILGICEQASYDGEPAIELEAAASQARLRQHDADAVDPSFGQNVALQFRYARCGDASHAEWPPRFASSEENSQDRADRTTRGQTSSTANGTEGSSASCISELKRYFSDESCENRTPRHRESAENALIVDPAPLLAALLDGIADGADARVLARAIHGAVARMAADVATAIAREHGLRTTALGGGVFMNRLILEEARERLEANGLRVLVPARIPLNDGGIAYGQAAIARVRYGKGLPSA